MADVYLRALPPRRFNARPALRDGVHEAELLSSWQGVLRNGSPLQTYTNAICRLQSHHT